LRERIKKLAKSIDALVDKDDRAIRQAEEIGQLRRKAALDLYTVCLDFVAEVNRALSRSELRLDPAVFTPDDYDDQRLNLFQINVRGRILQTQFRATPEMKSTEEFRIPYILEGAVRCFNQQLLEQDLIEEQLLFYCMEKNRSLWRYFDARTYRTGAFDQEYLVSLMEHLI